MSSMEKRAEKYARRHVPAELPLPAVQIRSLRRVVRDAYLAGARADCAPHDSDALEDAERVS
jgi:hypothetical protein